MGSRVRYPMQRGLIAPENRLATQRDRAGHRQKAPNAGAFARPELLRIPAEGTYIAHAALLSSVQRTRYGIVDHAVAGKTLPAHTRVNDYTWNFSGPQQTIESVR